MWPMDFRDVIIRKRDGGTLPKDEIAAFVRGLSDGSLAAEQVSALAMAILLKGFDARETAALTHAMAHSGVTIDWRGENLGGPVLDKHSTGGVGDKVSLMLAPIVAACGGFVPMISGRGLGHTGGTLDKLSAIPGYDATPDLARFKRVVKEVGCAIVGQTSDLAPADRRFYSIRDVTGTVESVPLITASILSKKVAAGLEGLVMDVKVGSGAFMREMAQAETLAKTLTATAAELGLPVHALITDMNETLGLTAGNALEVRETLDYLTDGPRETRLHEVVMALAAEMLLLGKIETDLAKGRARAEAALTSGKAAEVFARMVAALGGPRDFLERAAHYMPAAPVVRAVAPERAGVVSAVDARAVGMAVIALGGGRMKIEDKLDLRVGFTDVARIGAAVGPDQPLALVHAADDAAADAAIAALRKAYVIADAAPPARDLVHARLT
ncbi:thymidine phosphorylase [alpha proteobacterium U9-1i]|nr:thymidine phosphorylase [alpha proteobacterium U9-1i]